MSVFDEKDEKILRFLKERSNASSRQIAKATLLPATTIHHRIRKLEQSKVIKRYTLELDPDATGRGFTVYVLISADIATLKAKHKTQYDIARDLRKLDCVDRVDIVSGGTDLVATVSVADVHAYDKVLLGKIQLIDGIDKTQSLIVIHRG